MFCNWFCGFPVISGIAMLTFALLMSARMGIFQETLYKQYGKHPREALFYNVSFPSASLIQKTFSHGTKSLRDQYSVFC